MKDNDALDALLHATAPIPLSEVRKLIDDSNTRLISKFLEELKEIATTINNHELARMKVEYWEDYLSDATGKELISEEKDAN